MLGQGVWDGAVPKVGAEDGSSDGGTTGVVTPSGEDPQECVGKVVGGLHHGDEGGGETVFEWAGLTKLCSGFGRA